MLVAGGLGEASSSRRSRQGAEHQGDSLHPNTKLTLLTASPPSPPRTGSSTRCTWRRVANSTSCAVLRVPRRRAEGSRRRRGGRLRRFHASGAPSSAL